jgi:hypothetical protein
VVKHSGGLNPGQATYGALAVTMDTKGDIKMYDVLPINQYSVDLQKEIDDAEWLGDFERADSVKIELEHIKHMIDNGELWYPTF